MNIPKSIKVGGHTIKVIVGSQRPFEKQGASIDWHNEIYIIDDYDSPESNMAEGFLHEIVEQINSKYEIDLEHKQITVLTQALFQVLRDNGLDFREVECEQVKDWVENAI